MTRTRDHGGGLDAAILSYGGAHLDTFMARHADLVAGTELYRLYCVNDAPACQDRLAQAHIWTRVIPYSDRWLRLGLPAPDQWAQLEAAL